MTEWTDEMRTTAAVLDLVTENRRLRDLLADIELLAAGNKTGCGTCHTILRRLDRTPDREPEAKRAKK